MDLVGAHLSLKICLLASTFPEIKAKDLIEVFYLTID